MYEPALRLISAALHLMLVALRLIYSVLRLISHIQSNVFSVPEFDEEVKGIVYKCRRVLTTLALTTEGAYSVQHGDPTIYSDDEEECQSERAWPDLQLPKAPSPAPLMSEEVKASIIADMLSQHGRCWIYLGWMLACSTREIMLQLFWQESVKETGCAPFVTPP